jgi:hypothetical protein
MTHYGCNDSYHIYQACLARRIWQETALISTLYFGRIEHTGGQEINCMLLEVEEGMVRHSRQAELVERDYE